MLLAKAHYRRGAALLALGRADEALAAHRASALAWPRRADAAAAAAMAAAASSASPEHLAEVLVLLCFLAMWVQGSWIMTRLGFFTTGCNSMALLAHAKAQAKRHTSPARRPCSGRVRVRVGCWSCHARVCPVRLAGALRPALGRAAVGGAGGRGAGAAPAVQSRRAAAAAGAGGGAPGARCAAGRAGARGRRAPGG